MPNWCSNTLTVEGPGAEKFFAELANVPPEEDTYAAGTIGDFIAHLIPQPQDTDDWLKWRQANWGSKWGACFVERIADDRLSFETAWSPPIPAIDAISERFPDVEFILAYAEGGFGFFGYTAFMGGVMIDQFESDQFWNGKDMQDDDDPEDALTRACLDHQLKYGLRS